jgi:DNA repair protein RecO
MKPKEELKIEAINLRTFKLSGYKVLSVYSKEYGLLKLSGSRLGGRSEPFVRNNYWISVGAGDIHKIIQSEFLEQFSSLSTELNKMAHAWQYVDFLEACSHPNEERSGEIFELLYSSLLQLNKEEQATFISNKFLWKLTELLGYKPSLSLCDLEQSECYLAKHTEANTWFDFEHGGIICEGCQIQPSRDSIRILPGICKSLKELNQNNISTTTNKSAADFVLSLLQRYLQKHTNRKIKSLKIFQQLKNS